MWEHFLVIPATWEAEIWRIKVPKPGWAKIFVKTHLNAKEKQKKNWGGNMCLSPSNGGEHKIGGWQSRLGRKQDPISKKGWRRGSNIASEEP
jgi:hypothetical protein